MNWIIKVYDRQTDSSKFDYHFEYTDNLFEEYEVGNIDIEDILIESGEYTEWNPISEYITLCSNGR